jgi:hypothetical protein
MVVISCNLSPDPSLISDHATSFCYLHAAHRAYPVGLMQPMLGGTTHAVSDHGAWLAHRTDERFRACVFNRTASA